MNKHQKEARELAEKLLPQETDSNSYNKYLNIIMKHIYPFQVIKNLKKLKQEKELIDNYISIITVFIDGLTVDDNKDEHINCIEFELRYEQDIYQIQEFSNRLDSYFNSINGKYKYIVNKEENTLHFFVELNIK